MQRDVRVDDDVRVRGGGEHVRGGVRAAELGGRELASDVDVVAEVVLSHHLHDAPALGLLHERPLRVAHRGRTDGARVARFPWEVPLPPRSARAVRVWRRASQRNALFFSTFSMARGASRSGLLAVGGANEPGGRVSLARALSRPRLRTSRAR